MSISELVLKSTDESLAAENYGLMLDVCDAVNSTNTRECIVAISKRLASTNQKVVLLCLSLVECIAKNCACTHREIASRQFTHVLEEINANCSPMVKEKLHSIVQDLCTLFGNDPSLGFMRDFKDSIIKTRGLFKARAKVNVDGLGRGEIKLNMGDVVDVIDADYDDWWKAEFNGTQGLVRSVNLQRISHEPHFQEQQNCAVPDYGQKAQRLLSLLHSLSPNSNPVANPEIQSLYTEIIAARPMLLQELSQVTQRKDLLLGLNERLAQSKSIYDNLMDAAIRAPPPPVPQFSQTPIPQFNQAPPQFSQAPPPQYNQQPYFYPPNPYNQ